MPYKKQPMDVGFQPKRFDAPDFKKDGMVQPLVLNDKIVMYLIWQDPDRVMILSQVERGERNSGIVDYFKSELRRMAETGTEPRNAYLRILRAIPGQLPVSMSLGQLVR